MSTQARVGVFTLLTVIGVFAAYYFITNFALHHAGYQIGIRFHDVGGLQEGSTVLISGVQVGEVTTVTLLPDQTVEVVCTIDPGTPVYRDSVFVVAVTITGSTTLTIEPPVHRTLAMVLPQQPLPVDQQPWGTLPPTLTDLLSAGQEQLKNFSKTMAVVNRELPRLAEKFNTVAGHTDALITHADSELSGLTGEMQTTVAELDGVIDVNGRNLSELTGNLNMLVVHNHQRLDALIGDLAKTADNLNKTMAGIASIAQDPVLHDSLVGTARNVQDATAKLKAIATDLENVTGDPKTQAELKQTIANLQGASAKANALLGTFSTAEGNEGEVPGPSPGASGVPVPPAPAGSGAPRAPRRPSSGIFSQPFVAAQVRETWTDRGGGPASDLNLVLLPGASTHLTVGANDLGYSTTYNFLVDKNSTNVQLGAGVLYSKLGVAALFRPFGGPVGVDARLYDPKHPTFDLYGDLRLSQRLELFYGQRNLWNNGSAGVPAFGIQVRY